VPGSRRDYLADIAEVLRRYRAETERMATAAQRRQAVREVAAMAEGRGLGAGELAPLASAAEDELGNEGRRLLDEWPAIAAGQSGVAHLAVGHRRRQGRGPEADRRRRPRALPSQGAPARALPFTAGVFPNKRENEDPARMFAGEGDPMRTNRRFHLLASGQPATRLSTAFDSVTLYGFDPEERPDIYGKIGTSGVSIATLDDMRDLFDGFDLCDPATSVSMTINGRRRRSSPCT